MSLSLETKREKTTLPEFTKKVGLFEAKVIAINPNAEEYNDILGIKLKEGSEATNYLGKNKEGDTKLTVDVWLEEIKNKDKFKVRFYLENKEKVKTDGTKKQYINNIGTCTWAVDSNDIADWIAKDRDCRVAYAGEEEFYTFLRTWLCEVDYKDFNNVLRMDWKEKLMKGNLKDVKSQIDGAYCGNVVGLATINTSIKNGETKQYQNVYNKAFMYSGSIKHFNLIDYDSSDVVKSLEKKKVTDSKNMKPHERFVLNVKGEYGCKDYYILKSLQEYNPNDDLVSSDKVISTDGADF